MQDTNKYGFISGGAIFDMLDRAALEYINKTWPSTVNENWFTKRSVIHFNLQVCSMDNMEIVVQKTGKDKKYEETFVHDNRKVVVALVDSIHKRIHAVAGFFFVKANKNHCVADFRYTVDEDKV